ncbi:MAG TPA: pirin family protein [Bacteroidota bacterium]|nr:pirin family protein [Bacteroidota bacterium]
MTEIDNRKAIRGHYHTSSEHWVGDGFPVRTLFSMQQLGAHISPFILLDYGGPVEFPPAPEPRGVDEHPHRGFETVTILYQGELEHRDSAGNSGKLGPGDVQWMTAASGIVHEEKHSREFTERGGVMEMAQLWINLPSRNKISPPAYQTLLREQIPVIQLPGESGTLRVIAGGYHGAKGPARTFTDVNVWDIHLKKSGTMQAHFQEDTTTLVVVLQGTIVVNEKEQAVRHDCLVFERPGEKVDIAASDDSVLLLLNGEPIDEPVVSYGPFVMNTKDEIAQAIEDHQTGRMGHLWNF